jgi:prophage tail gpP-like protein
MKLKINGNFFVFFNDVNIQRKFDSVASTFSFNARFNPDNPEHRDIFRPGQYQTIEIFDDNDILIFTGTVINTEFVSGPLPSLVKLSGYSLAGILEDCNIPVNAYPLESINRSLRDIVTRLLNIFGLGLVIQNTQVLRTSQTRTLTRASALEPLNSFVEDISGIDLGFGNQLVTEQSQVIQGVNEVDIIYPKSVAEPTESIKSYISKLCSQRNIVLSHNNRGDVILLRPDLSNIRYGFNEQNTLTMRLVFAGQGMHSDISILRQPSEENEGVSTVSTARNPVISQFRPKIKTLSSGEDTDVTRAADNELASELKNISLKISVNSVLDLNPGDIVDVINPRIFLFNRTKFIIKDINFKGNNESSTTEFMLVLPETYTSQIPENIFV